jgi:hypothetical protein
MIELPTGIPAELAPLSWLIGVWEGSGIVSYAVGEQTQLHEFGQRVSFSHDGLPYLNYNSYTWLISDAEAGAGLTERENSHDHQPLVTETGYWRLSRPAAEADPGPAMLPGIGEPAYPSAQAVEALRNAAGGFDIEVSLLHPTGVSELYLGQVMNGRIDLATDAVMRSATAKPYAAATRLYGLVQGDLLWAWDIAALGQDLRSHASAKLVKVD